MHNYFAQLPDLHNSFRELAAKTTQIMHANEKKNALSGHSAFPPKSHNVSLQCDCFVRK